MPATNAFNHSISLDTIIPAFVSHSTTIANRSSALAFFNNRVKFNPDAINDLDLITIANNNPNNFEQINAISREIRNNLLYEYYRLWNGYLYDFSDQAEEES